MANEREELKARVEARRKALEARLYELEADARHKMSDHAEKLRGRLGELQELLADGWTALTEQAAARVNTWLRREEEDEKENE